MNCLETERLWLRHWKQSDLIPFRAMNQSKRVMKYFPNTLDNNQSDMLASRIQKHLTQYNWGLWALELKETNEFIGFTGLQTVSASLNFQPATEIGWRLDSRFWLRGYATEAALFVVRYAEKQLNMQELISFTAKVNLPSIGVMRKIGMSNTNNNFMHPNVPEGHPLQEHVLYRLLLAKS